MPWSRCYFRKGCPFSLYIWEPLFWGKRFSWTSPLLIHLKKLSSTQFRSPLLAATRIVLPTGLGAAEFSPGYCSLCLPYVLSVEGYFTCPNTAYSVCQQQHKRNHFQRPQCYHLVPFVSTTLLPTRGNTTTYTFLRVTDGLTTRNEPISTGK